MRPDTRSCSVSLGLVLDELHLSLPGSADIRRFLDNQAATTRDTILEDPTAAYLIISSVSRPDVKQSHFGEADVVECKDPLDGPPSMGAAAEP